MLPYLKTPSKIVQSTLTFLSALSLVRQENKALDACLNPELFVNKTTFFQKASKSELCYLMKAYT